MSEAKLFAERIVQARELLDQGKTREAETLTELAATEFPRGWIGLGCEYLTAKDHDAAYKIFAQGLKLTKDPELIACICNNMGLIANEQGNREDAFELFQLSDKHDHTPMAITNIGLYRFWRGEYDVARGCYLEALRMNPHFVEAEFNLSLLNLKLGNWTDGWRMYESRFRKRSTQLRKIELNRPEWTGEPIDHLLVVGEQGNGDMIMVARMAELIAPRVKRQTWVTQKNLGSLLGTVQGIEAVEDLKEVGQFNAFIHSMSLFRLFGITPETLPNTPYLPRPSDAVDYGPGFHVGIVWKGNSEYSNNFFRSSLLEDWRELIELNGVIFHSLQVAGGDEGLVFPQLIPLNPAPKTWLDTARVMAGLDLVIAIDTGPAHLAGAMGLPAWIILGKSAEWRWGMDARRTVWYPTARLFRMEKELAWKETIHTVTHELKNYAHLL